MRAPSGFAVSTTALSLPGFACHDLGHTKLYYTSHDRHRQPVRFLEDDRRAAMFVGYVFGANAEAFCRRLMEAFPDVQGVLEGVNGEFALVVLDKASGHMVAASDKIGHREIYAKTWNGNLVLFTDLTQLRHLRPNRFCSLGVSLFIKFGYPLAPCTYFQDVSMLPGGYFWHITQRGRMPRHQRYWRIEKKHNVSGEKDFVPLLAEKVIASCRHRANQGLNPLFLSGGLDSASVLHAFLKLGLPLSTGFIVFTGYTPQERFADIARRLADSVRVPFRALKYEWSHPKAWDNLLEAVGEVYCGYASQPAFVEYLKTAGDAVGDGPNFFWGESADGLFGLNLTFEDDVDRYLGMNRNMVRSARFYADRLGNSGLLRAISRAVVSGSGLCDRCPPLSKLAQRFEFMASAMSSHLSFDQYFLGYYFNPRTLPGFSRHHLRHPLLTREALEAQVAFLKEEYLSEAELHYAEGGIGSASKYLIFRLENMSVDIRMKRITGAFGLRPTFPLYDAEVCEAIYSIPHRFFVFGRERRPKEPLRAMARQALGVPEWLIAQKKAANLPNGTDPEIAGFAGIEKEFREYTREPAFLGQLEDRFFQLDAFHPAGVSRFREASAYVILEHLAREYL